VTYENTGDAPEYVKPSIVVFSNLQNIGTVGDEQPFIIEKGRKLGRSYPLRIDSGDVSANITAFYGLSKKSFENGIQTMLSAGRVQFTDSSLLDIKDFNRDKETNDLFVSFANTGNVTAYFKSSAAFDMNGTATTIKDDNTYKLAPGEGRMVKFPGIAKSSTKILVLAEYGAREAFLGKNVQKTFSPSRETGQIDIALVIGLALTIIAVVALFMWNMKKKG
jgi:hypothetical protein